MSMAGTSFSLAEHLPALQVVIPLMAAPVAVLIRRNTPAWSLAAVITWICLAIAITLLNRVLDTGTISYALGGWAAPWGIEYRIDRIGAFMLVIVSAIGAVVVPYARASVAREISPDRQYLFYAMYLLCLAGLLGIAITGDAFNLFVFLEISSLSSYVLISLARDRRSLTAAYRYLIMGTIGATFYIIGVGLMYMMTGTLNMADLAQRIPAIAETRTVLVALGFLVVGISLKLALFPLHAWLPNAYAFAPSAVTVFLASTATKIAIYVLLRVLFTIFGKADVIHVEDIGAVLMVLAVVAMFVASTVAIFQDNVKRLLAFSSVAQVGYIILGISLVSQTGVAAGIIHVFNHALMKGALFMAVGCVFLRTGSMSVSAFAGLGRRMPVTMAAFVVGGLSLIGVPATVGFVSKWYLIQAALEAGLWPLAVLILLSSLLAVIYVWKVVEVAYFQEPPSFRHDLREAPLSMTVPMWLLAGGCIYFGLDAETTFGIAHDAAGSLLGVLP
ncbi:MAG: monovalent cation/H+ antiporter subunit D family protein [Rhodobacterales bacterium]|nr:monovalent cation/H+ antiporter subunit D family protein [Rhodobacterales bacterium]